MISEFRRKILEVVNKNDGKLSWYQLDRQLSQNGIAMSENLMQAINYLESEGLISIRKGVNPQQPLYSITPEGAKCIKESEEK